MISTKTNNPNYILSPFAGIESLSTVVEGPNFGPTSERSETAMELPVNNYLKTPDEIEMEFKYGINPGRLHLRKDPASVPSIMKTDGYLNIHNLDDALSGFMEENY